MRALLLFVLAVVVQQLQSVSLDTVESMGIVSRIVYINEIAPDQTIQYDFKNGTKVFVSSSSDEKARKYEEKIYIKHITVNGDVRTISSVRDAAKNVSADGTKQEVHDVNGTITIVNENLEKADFDKTGLIYFVTANADFNNTVYESGTKKTIHVDSKDIAKQFVTILNPTGAMVIKNVEHIYGLTMLAIHAGGVEEAKDMQHLISLMGANEAESKAPLIITEPVVTLQKQLAITESDFMFDVEAYTGDLSKPIQVAMNWSDISVAMSPNYKLRTRSSSIKYVFNASLDDSDYRLEVSGDIDATSSLNIGYEGYDGSGNEIMSNKKGMDQVIHTTKGNILTVDYTRGKQDVSEGVLLRISCRRIASSRLFYIPVIVALIKYII